MSNPTSQVVLVTGAGSGIGQAIALAFAAEGARLVLGGRTESKLQATAETIRSKGGKAVYVAGDVGLETINKQLVEKAISEYGELHIAVNNAGGLTQQPIVDTDDENLEKTLSANVKSVIWGTKHQLPAIGKTSTSANPGNIINIGSLVSTRPGASPSAIYSGAKGFVDTFTRASAKEGREHNVRVNSINPGIVASPGALDIFGGIETANSIAKAVSLTDRAGTPEEIAEFVLAVVKNKFINGSNLIIDGGASST
ncbi:hypothetical protein HKX48_006901 [Thoreauomyces humboldtii]|nr:hypothetical protein HKX48_006901 [Thoreauomyces humboldtii]